MVNPSQEDDYVDEWNTSDFSLKKQETKFGQNKIKKTEKTDE
jgi:hypothetical protein